MTRGDAAPPGTPGEVLAREGDALAADGEFEAALFKYDEALREDELVNRHHPRVAMRYCSVGALYRATGDVDAALEYFAKAVQVEEMTERPERRTALASYLSNLGGAYRAAGDAETASRHYCRALDHIRRIIPPLPDVPAAVAAEESALFEREMALGETSPLHDPLNDPSEPTLEDTSKLLGPSGALNVAASVLNNLGLLYKSLGEPHCARRLYARSIALATIAVGEFDPAIGTRVRNLGAALLALGHVERAAEKLDKARDMCALGLGPDHPETVACARWLDAAGEGAGVGDQAQNFADAANLPEIAEWFVTTLNCGVLEPPREPPLEGEPEVYRPTPEGDDGVSPIFMGKTPTGPEARENAAKTAEEEEARRRTNAARDSDAPTIDLDPNVGSRRSEANPSSSTRKHAADEKTRPSAPSTSLVTPPPVPKALNALFAPLEARDGEDMLTPYARPAATVVGGSEASPVWRSVARERADIAGGGGAMPRGQDYIAAYLKQAPGYANLITPFQEMPGELLMPYSAYKGYGVPRADKDSLPRLAHAPKGLGLFGDETEERRRETERGVRGRGGEAEGRGFGGFEGFTGGVPAPD
jgi:tetratricopeptide (TPR) repeat protein